MLTFLSGAFFEIMVCVSISMRKYSLIKYLNGPDKFSVVNHIGVTVTMLSFIVFVTFFTIFRMPSLQAIYYLEKLKIKEKRIASLRRSFKEKEKIK